MNATIFTKFGGFNPYVVLLKIEHQYTRFNLPFAEGHAKDPSKTITLNTGEILWSQEKPFTIEQINDLKERGFPYQWGFGPCCEMIPFEKISFAKVELFNI